MLGKVLSLLSRGLSPQEAAREAGLDTATVAGQPAVVLPQRLAHSGKVQRLAVYLDPHTGEPCIGLVDDPGGEQE